MKLWLIIFRIQFSIQSVCLVNQAIRENRARKQAFLKKELKWIRASSLIGLFFNCQSISGVRFSLFTEFFRQLFDKVFSVWSEFMTLASVRDSMRNWTESVFPCYMLWTVHLFCMIQSVYPLCGRILSSRQCHLQQ